MPPVPPLLQLNHSGLNPPLRGASRTQQYNSLPNSLNTKFAGISLGPLRSLDVEGSVDLAGGKKKLLSGEHALVNNDVITQVAWPNNCLDNQFCPSPPVYMEMSPTEFAAGYTGKILAEMEQEFRGS